MTDMNSKKTHIVDPHYFILFQHGVLGSASDFEKLVSGLLAGHAQAAEECRGGGKGSNNAQQDDNRRDRFTLKTEYVGRGRRYQSGNLVCFAPGDNNFLKTDAGTQRCAMRMLCEFIPVFQAWLGTVEATQQHIQKDQDKEQAHILDNMDTTTSDTKDVKEKPRVPVCFSCVGHSFGGIILREFLYLLLVDEEDIRAHRNPTTLSSFFSADKEPKPSLYETVQSVRQQMHRVGLTFENYITIATPHCGTSECLWWPMYAGAWCLSKVSLFKTYGELIAVDANQLLLTRLLGEGHLKALQVFRRRTLFSNAHRDLLVGFGTGSLIYETAVQDADHATVRGFSPNVSPCSPAFDSEISEVSEPIFLPQENTATTTTAAAATTSTPSTGAVPAHTMGSLWRGAAIHDKTISMGSSASVSAGEEAAMSPDDDHSCSEDDANHHHHHHANCLNYTDTHENTVFVCAAGSVGSGGASDSQGKHISEVVAGWQTRVQEMQREVAVQRRAAPGGWRQRLSQVVLRADDVGASPPSSPLLRTPLSTTQQRRSAAVSLVKYATGVVRTAWHVWRRTPPPPPSSQADAETGDEPQQSSTEVVLYDPLQSTRRLTPRLIAKRLREALSWRVRVIRYQHMFPVAHVACLGHCSALGTSPAIVDAVVGEIAHILAA